MQWQTNEWKDREEMAENEDRKSESVNKIDENICTSMAHPGLNSDSI